MSEKEYSPIGRDWDDVRKEIFTPEENAASDARVAIMCALIEARQKKGITQKKLEELSGVRQPIIARMETGATIPQIDTVLKVLAPLGKTLYVGDIEQEGNGIRKASKPAVAAKHAEHRQTKTKYRIHQQRILSKPTDVSFTIHAVNTKEYQE